MTRHFYRVPGAFWIGVLTVLFLGACSPTPAPKHSLTDEEKTADMYWLYSQFNENYAPMQLKADKYRFDWKTLKSKYLDDAIQTKNNEQFYLLMHRFVAEFHDAHTSDSLYSSTLPGRTQIAYLGFDGYRVGDTFKVDKLLPTISASSAFPIKSGDVISKLDGVLLPEVLKRDLLPYRNVGDDEANLTYLMPKLFNRTSIANPLPTSPDAVLTVVRAGKEVEVKIPWVVKDLYTFTAEQKAAATKAAGSTSEVQRIGSLTQTAFFDLGLKILNHEVPMDLTLAKMLMRDSGQFNFKNNFFFLDTAPTWSSKSLAKLMTGLQKQEPTIEEFKRERSQPSNLLYLQNDTFPTYLTMEKVLDKDGKATGAMKPVVYVYLNTFSPGGGEKAVIEEFSKAIKQAKAFGVKDFIFDMIDNGGGSLSFGLKLAQSLSKKRIDLPDIQFKVSESWTDSFQADSLASSESSDAEQELARRIFQDLSNDRERNQSLSRRYSMQDMMPFQFEPNDDMDSDVNIYLLVNEMCASMCDIFTATLQDNKMATVIGTKTMGAGGNVVGHREAPNSHLVVNQTESLIVRKDGSYIENAGVTPDVPFNVNASVLGKYDAVRQKAIELIVKAK